MDRSPILAITGQTDTDALHKESHQNMDVITMFKPITKWNWSIRNSDNIPEIIRRAFKISLEEKAGAVHLELPKDIAKEKSEIRPIRTQKFLRSRPNRELVKSAARLICMSRMPVLLVGNGCIRGNASLHLRRFAEKTRIYSMNTFMAKGVISDKSKRHLQTIGIKEADHAQVAMKEADVVIAVGYDLVEYSPINWNGDLKKKIIHIDFTPAEVDTYYPPTIEIAADIGYTIDAILEEVEMKGKKLNPNMEYVSWSGDPALLKQVKQEVVWRIEKHKNDYSYPIRPEKLINDIRSALDDRDIIISDVGIHKLWIAKAYSTYKPNTCIITNGFCSMGFALPGAIAAQLAVRLSLPIIIIVWCDSDLGMISLKQIEEFGKSAFTRFNNPDFVKLADSFGAHGYDVKSSKDLPSLMKKAKESTHIPVVISVNIDYSRNRMLLDDSFSG
jgi:acetolactate synthase-1/2/3 large subunit